MTTTTSTKNVHRHPRAILLHNMAHEDGDLQGRCIIKVWSGSNYSLKALYNDWDKISPYRAEAKHRLVEVPEGVQRLRLALFEHYEQGDYESFLKRMENIQPHIASVEDFLKYGPLKLEDGKLVPNKRARRWGHFCVGPQLNLPPVKIRGGLAT